MKYYFFLNRTGRLNVTTEDNMDIKKNALLLGGTGAMGRYLQDELVAMGFNVVVTTRSTKKSENSNIHYLTGNAKDLVFLKEILSKNWDVIFDFMVYETSDFIERVLILLESCKQYFFISSYRVFNDSEVPINESSLRLLDSVKDDIYLSTDEYGLAKARQENILGEMPQKNWTIIRPSITYSVNRLQFGVLEWDTIVYRSINNSPIVFPSEMLNKYTTMTWAGDVAYLMAQLIGIESAMGEAFNVVTDEHITWSNVYKVYKDELNSKLVTIPVSEYLKRISSNQYQVKYDRMFNRKMDNSKILSVTDNLDYSFMPLEKGLRKEINNSITDVKNLNLDFRLNAQMDKIAKILPNLSKIDFVQKLKYIKWFVLNK